MRAWRFSSVMSGSRSANRSASTPSYAFMSGSMASSSSSVPRFSAIAAASARVPSDEYGEGMVTHTTRSAPGRRPPRAP